MIYGTSLEVLGIDVIENTDSFLMKSNSGCAFKKNLRVNRLDQLLTLVMNWSGNDVSLDPMSIKFISTHLSFFFFPWELLLKLEDGYPAGSAPLVQSLGNSIELFPFLHKPKAILQLTGHWILLRDQVNSGDNSGNWDRAHPHNLYGTLPPRHWPPDTAAAPGPLLPSLPRPLFPSPLHTTPAASTYRHHTTLRSAPRNLDLLLPPSNNQGCRMPQQTPQGCQRPQPPPPLPTTPQGRQTPQTTPPLDAPADPSGPLDASQTLRAAGRQPTPQGRQRPQPPPPPRAAGCPRKPLRAARCPSQPLRAARRVTVQGHQRPQQKPIPTP
ncbi:hypothetical protein VP01_76g1 [Puccinia sorghi]|uniref:Uncharacterized protein n=1 Tax=Puccinia sorghi TaxID=27349 RepID=A0A0L6UBI8_9BASI|nr:hypothetical protein VP01_76g1 [Puccinia sorghi]